MGLFRRKKKATGIPEIEVSGSELSEAEGTYEAIPQLPETPQKILHKGAGNGVFESFQIWLGSIFAKPVLTINIESTDIRFMLCKGRRIKKWGSYPLASGIVQEGQIVDHKALCNALNELVSSKHLKKIQTIISLSGIQTVNRIIELPQIPKKLFAEAVGNEAQRVMPLSLDQIYLSWHGFGGKRKGELQKFFLLGIPQNMMDEQVQCLRQTGVSPRSVQLKPIVLAEMINLPKALIIDIESESCTIIVVADGIPSIMRSVIINSAHNPSEKAQNVLQEFEKTLRFYESTYPDNPIEQETPLFLTGQLVEGDKLYQAISSATEHNVEPLGSSLKCPADFSLAKFAVNIGLAKKGMPHTSKRATKNGRFLITNFNILPDVYRPKGLPKNQIAFVFAIMTGIALVVPLYNMAGDASDDLSQLKAENNILDQRVLVRQNQNKQAQEIRDAIAAATDSLESVKQTKSSVLSYLDELEDKRALTYRSLYASTVLLKPAGINLASISQESGEINVTGQAFDYQTAIDYAYALREKGKPFSFSDVQIQVMGGSNDEAAEEDMAGDEIFNNAYVVERGGTLTVPAPGVLENDADTDGNRLAAIKMSDPEFGSLTLNRDGSFTYVHSGLAEIFDSFTYVATDGVRPSSEAIVNIIIAVEGVNYSVPVASDDSYGGGIRGGGQEGDPVYEDEELGIIFTISFKWEPQQEAK